MSGKELLGLMIGNPRLVAVLMFEILLLIGLLPGAFASAIYNSSANQSQNVTNAPTATVPQSAPVVYTSPTGLFVSENTPYTITVSISSIPTLPYKVILYFCTNVNSYGQCPQNTSNLLASVECTAGGCPTAMAFEPAATNCGNSACIVPMRFVPPGDPAIDFNMCTGLNGTAQDFTCLKPNSYYVEACVIDDTTTYCSKSPSTLQVLLNPGALPTTILPLPSNTLLCSLFTTYQGTVDIVLVGGTLLLLCAGILFLILKFRPKLIKESKHVKVRGYAIAFLMGGIIGVIIALLSPIVFQVVAGYSASQVSTALTQVCAPITVA